MRFSSHHRRGLYAPELLEARIAPATFIVTNLLGNNSDGTLRKAISDADLQPGADTIVFQNGLAGTINLGGAELEVQDTLTIKGPGRDVITINGQDMSRLFIFDDTDPTVQHPASISGLTLRDGKSASRGGAIFSAEPLTLTDVVVASCTAATYGGGVFAGTAGTVVISDSQFVGNHADKGSGGLHARGDEGVVIKKTLISGNDSMKAGGLYTVTAFDATVLVDACVISNNISTGDVGGVELFGGLQVVKNTRITGNTAGGNGGGIFMGAGTDVVLDKCTFAANSADRGGAVWRVIGESLTIKKSTFSGNKATLAAGGGGGALYLKGSAPVSIVGSVFTGNDSASVGGAISNSGSTQLTVTGSLFLSNHATSTGGAIFMHDAAVVSIGKSTLSGNKTDTSGGAVFVDQTVKLTVIGSTLSGNVATTSGGAIGVANGASLTATGNKITENHAGLYGGGIFANTTTGALTLSGNRVSANTADVDGGGARFKSSAAITMTGDKFIGNGALAGVGGGLDLKGSGGITVTGLLFQDNYADNAGGGLCLSGSAALTGLKVIGNTVSAAIGGGGGIAVFSGTVTIAKSVITGNFAYQGGGIYDGANTTLDPTTKVTRNSAIIEPNTSGI